MAIFGSIKTARAQTAASSVFKIAFDYIDECSRPGTAGRKLLDSLEAGKSERVELGGGVFAMPQVYMTKSPRTAGFYESHFQYIDVQAVIVGEEIIEVADVSDLKLKEDRTPASDVLIYEQYDNGAAVRLHAGEAAVLWPVDGHMPCIAVAAQGSALVRKVVVKVPV
ncbi:MAG: YhcH/YjgK/YiaL family protein [Opitutaceae bacterium]|jgi:YhcH/YjgK/YiaL family protein|nr:YhcH/YjgK/YiaL family protein [Opitutaceae bacterium]